MSFTYDDNGIRTSKTVNGVKHTYYLNGSQITAEQWGDKLLVYLYDASGSPIGMMYSTTSYAEGAFDVFWFDKNLQGDIVAVYNESGTKVAAYTYSDAWGDHSVTYSNGGASTGAQYNPFRYRGYYYDTDLGMYYLQSRYYDPNTCRFINADGALYHSMLGYNLFAYCENNPVNMLDTTGQYCVDIMDNDGNPFNDWMDLVGQGGGGAKAGYYGPGTAYYNYQVRMGTAAYDARLGGYHSLGLSSAMINPNYYCVSGAVSVTDSMATNSGGNQTKYSTKSTQINTHYGRSLPPEGTPNSISSLYSKGELKQQRIYGSNGRAIVDIDYFHSGPNHKFPHIHIFDWSLENPRSDAINLF